ncbi:MAG: UGMP family protein [Nanoarchaeota archaeon]|nr:UGMP family protein [Nanoarchaeota archaeon]
MVTLGIESTAHTFGVGIVNKGKILANVREMYVTESGGIIPMESAKHHVGVANEVYERALKEAGISEDKIRVIAFSRAPGLAPCLIEGMKFAKEKSKKLKVPLVGVNHCVAHLEVGGVVGAKDPVMLYVSGANTQIIAYEAGKYRIFGETLDMGVGNFIDTFARYLNLGFPGGPKVEQLASASKNYIELPYTVKGMDIALSGILTNLRQKIERMNSISIPPTRKLHSQVQDIDKKVDDKSCLNNTLSVNTSNKYRVERANYTKEDLCYSMQETVFAMLVEVSERALAHTGKKELLLGGGVACNSRLQEMCKIMCEERGAKMFVPENSLLVDNGAFIAFTGEIMFNSGVREKENVDINARERTDQVSVCWK